MRVVNQRHTKHLPSGGIFYDITLMVVVAFMFES